MLTARSLVLLVLLASTQALQLVCNCSDQVDWNVGQSNQLSLSTIGGSGRYTYSYNGLPPGLNAQNSVILGAPQTEGQYPVTIISRDDSGNSASKTIYINVQDGGSANIQLSGGQSAVISPAGGTVVRESSYRDSASTSSSSSSSQGSTISISSDGTIVRGGTSFRPQFTQPTAINMYGGSAPSGGYIVTTQGNINPSPTGSLIFNPSAGSGSPTTAGTAGSPASPGSQGTLTLTISGGSGPNSPGSTFGPVGTPRLPGIPGFSGTGSLPGTGNYPSGGQPSSAFNIATGTTTTTTGTYLTSGTPNSQTPGTSPPFTGGSRTPGFPSGPSAPSSISFPTATPTGSNPPYATGPTASFPVPQYPTGTSPNFLPSTIPTQIGAYNYKRNETRDSYEQSLTQIQSQAAYTNAMNLIMQMGNLQSIISQKTANINGLQQQDIPQVTALLNQAIQQQRASQQSVTQAMNTNSTLQGQINDTKNNINNIQGQLAQFYQNVNDAKNYIEANTTLRTKLAGQVGDSNNQLSSIQQSLANAQAAKTKIQNDINAATKDITSLSMQIATIQSDIEGAGVNQKAQDDNIKDLDTQIAALQAQLADLQARRNAAKNRSDYFKNLPVSGPSQIRQITIALNNRNNTLYSALQPDQNRAAAAIADLTERISQIQGTIQDFNTKSRQVESFIAVSQRLYNQNVEQYNNLQNSLKVAVARLDQLNQQAPGIENAVTAAYYNGNDINDKVIEYKNILKTMQDSAQQQIAERSQAYSDLDNVRRQFATAGIALNELVYKVAGPSVPYFAIPGSAGATRTSSTISSTTTTTSSGTTGTAGIPGPAMNTMTIRGPVLKNGQWVVSNTSAADGTVVGTTVDGVQIVAGSGNSSGAVVGVDNAQGAILVSGSGAPPGTVVGQARSGARIVAGGQSAPSAGTVMSTSGGIIVSMGNSASSSVDSQGNYITVVRTITFGSEAAGTPVPQPSAPTGDLSNYISGNLNRGVPMSSIYSFLLNWPSTRGQGIRGAQDFSCSGNNMQGGTATIRSINQNAGTITLNLEGGGSQVVRLGPCTQLQANTPNYQPSIGDRVNWRGYADQNAGVINAASLYCSA